MNEKLSATMSPLRGLNFVDWLSQGLRPGLTSRAASRLLNWSREAGIDGSPGREPWAGNLQGVAAPKGRRVLSLSLAGVLLLFGCTAKTADQPNEEHIVTVDVAPVLSSAISLK